MEKLSKLFIWSVLLTLFALEIFLIPAKPGRAGAQDSANSLVKKDTSGVYEAGAGETEMASERTRAFKKFDQGNGHYRVAGQVGPIHYKTDPFSTTEQFKEIDLTITEPRGKAWDFEMEKNGYQVRFWNSRKVKGEDVNYLAKFERAGQWLEMAPLALVWTNTAGDVHEIATPTPGITPEIDNDAYRITWKNIFGPGVDFRYNVSPDEFFKTLIINNYSDLPTPEIDTAGLELQVIMAVSWVNNAKTANNFGKDHQPNELSSKADLIEKNKPSDKTGRKGTADEKSENPEKFAFKDDSSRDIWWLQKPRAWDSAETPNEFEATQTLERKGSQVYATYGISNNTLTNKNTIYPFYLDTDITEEQVGASADDARSWGTTWPGFASRGTANELVVGEASSTWYGFGARLTTVPIPASSTIDSAFCRLMFSRDELEVFTFRSYMELEANPADFSARIPLAATRTTGFGTYTTGAETAGQWYDMSDMAVAVQEVIDLAGWAENNAVAMLIADSGATSNKWSYVYAWNQPGNVSGPKFNASYTTNSAPTNDSLTFTNPYSTNVAVADDTTEWNFRALVTDADGSTNIDDVVLRLADSADNTTPFDALKFSWDEATDTFSEVADTQNAATLTSTSANSSAVGNQWTLDFKVQINDSFLTKDTNYAAELYTTDDAAASDEDSYADFYQVTATSLTANLDSGTKDFGSLTPGTPVLANTTVTVSTNFPNGYTLAVSDAVAGSDSALVQSGTYIADYAGTIALPTLWSGTGLGISVWSATGKNTSQWGTGTTYNDANNKYAGIPQNSTVIHTKTGSPTSNDATSVGYKLDTGNSQKTGSYSGDITYTITGVLE